MALLSPNDLFGQTRLVLSSQFLHQAMEIQQEGISAGSVLQHVPNARKTIVGEMHRGEFLIQAAEEFPVRKHFENAPGLILMQNGGQLARLLVSIQAFPGAIFQSRVEPALGAFIRLKIEPHPQTQQAIDPRGIVKKAAGLQGANFVPLDIASAVGGVEQQAAGVGMERDGHGVDGEIAALQVLKDHGGANLRPLPGTRVDFFPAHGQLGAHAIGKKQLGRR